jgi:hypothetical protein
MREALRIKQIAAIPDGFTVLSQVKDENGKKHMEDLMQSGWHYMFALIDGGEWDDDYVALYELDPVGCGDIDSGVSRIVPKQKCPNCGMEMTPHWDEKARDPLSYTCSCGAKSSKM